MEKAMIQEIKVECQRKRPHRTDNETYGQSKNQVIKKYEHNTHAILNNTNQEDRTQQVRTKDI